MPTESLAALPAAPRPPITDRPRPHHAFLLPLTLASGLVLLLSSGASAAPSTAGPRAGEVSPGVGFELPWGAQDGSCDDCDTSLFVGSMKTVIKDSQGTATASNSPAERNTDDPELIIQALLATGQNTYTYFADDGNAGHDPDGDPDTYHCDADTDTDGDGTSDRAQTGTRFCTLIDLLEASEGTGLRILAGVSEKHGSGDAANRWLEDDDANGDGIADPYFYERESCSNGDTWCCEDVSGSWYAAETVFHSASEYCYKDGYPETRERWAAALSQAGEEFSRLSLRYPHLVAMVVDDFGGEVASIVTNHSESDRFNLEGQYNEENLSNIYASTKSHNPDFQFWPIVYYTRFPYLVADSHSLGKPDSSNNVSYDMEGHWKGEELSTVELSEGADSSTPLKDDEGNTNEDLQFWTVTKEQFVEMEVTFEFLPTGSWDAELSFAHKDDYENSDNSTDENRGKADRFRKIVELNDDEIYDDGFNHDL